MPTPSARSRRPAISSTPLWPNACTTTSIRPAARSIRKTPMSPSAAASPSPTRCCAAAACWRRPRSPDPGSSFLRGRRVGVGVPPQNALVEAIDLSAFYFRTAEDGGLCSPACGRGAANPPGPVASVNAGAFSSRQKPADQRQEEDRDIDDEADVPEDRSEPRAVAEIGEDIGDAHDQEQHRQFVDQVLRGGAEFGQQNRHGEERKGLDAVLMRAQRTGADGVLVERRVTRLGIVIVAKPDPFDRYDGQ